MEKRGNKVGVIGAGLVGSAVCYALLLREVAPTIALFDIDLKRAEAEVLDLAHGTLFMGASRIIGGGDPSCLKVFWIDGFSCFAHMLVESG